MKRLLISWCIVAAVTGILSGQPAPTAVRHALVVTIGQYPAASGFRPIDGDNDRKIILQLLRQMGFTDTIVLANEAATREGFSRGFDKLLMNVHAGDVVFIHFSTHGQQIGDPGHDEADGYDEAIALYDARTGTGDGYHGQNHLTDDDFGVMVAHLREKLGKQGDILVLVDACHSGSMSRGSGIEHTRGGYPPILLNGASCVPATRGEITSGNKDGGKETASPGYDHGGMIDPPPATGQGNDLANFVMVSACQNDEISSEYCYNRNYFGPLTFAFMNAVLKNKSETCTYKKLFSDIRFGMAAMFGPDATHQHPAMETAGPGSADRIFLGGRIMNQHPFFSISSFTGPDRIIIDGGTIAGLYDNSLVTVYPSGTTDPSAAGAPVATGRITASNCLASTVHLDVALDPERPGDYWVFLSGAAPGVPVIRIKPGTFSDAGMKKMALEELQKSRYALIADADPDYILDQHQGTAGGMMLLLPHSRRPCREHILPGDLDVIMQHLALVRHLKALSLSDPGTNMEISLETTSRAGMSKTGPTCRVRAGIDTAYLVIKNSGEKSFYFNLVDIDPEDHGRVILPDPDRPVSACHLNPGQEFRAGNVFSEPYGTELLKVITSRGSFDLRPVFDDQDTQRGDLDDLVPLLANPDATRGASNPGEPAAFATFNYYFEVIKP